MTPTQHPPLTPFRGQLMPSCRIVVSKARPRIPPYPLLDRSVRPDAKSLPGDILFLIPSLDSISAWVALPYLFSKPKVRRLATHSSTSPK